MLSYISSFFYSSEAKPTAVVSIPVNVPAKAIWSLFRDFSKWSKWFPLIMSESVVGQVKEGVGMIRKNTTITGVTFEDIIKEFDDVNMRLSYNYVSIEPKIPIIQDYRATLQVTVINEKQSQVTWQSWTSLVSGTDESKLAPLVESQMKFYTKAIQAAVLSITLHKLYEESFGVMTARMMDITKALLVGQNPVWGYETYEVQPLPKMVRGLPTSEALPPMKFGQMLGRLLETVYMQANHFILHADDKLPPGVNPYEAAALQIANTYGNQATKELTAYLAKHWGDDVEFCQQFLQGANPLQIQLVNSIDEIPENMRKLKAQGKTIEDLIHAKRLFIADYGILEGFKPHSNLHFYCPTVLMFRELLDKGESRLNIVGIRLERTKNAKVYTPDMPHKNRFKLAKMFAACADNQVHQFGLHLGIAHLGMEPIIVAVHNALPEAHPIHAVLKPHMQETIGINFLARQTLIAQQGAFTDETFALGTAQGVVLASKMYSQYDFYGFSFPEQLKSRGFDRQGSEGLTNYLYRDDGYKLWDLLGNYLTEYTNAHYADDAAVQHDATLQEWAKEMAAPEKAAVPGFKPEILTKKDLVLALQIIIWNASALHSFLNFPQWPYVGNIPNRPNAMYALMPDENGHDIGEDFIQKALAPAFGTAFQLTFTWALSLPSNTTLMDLGNQQKETGGEVGKKFYDSLVKLTNELNERNAKLAKEGKAPYPYLLPENVACSVDI